MTGETVPGPPAPRPPSPPVRRRLRVTLIAAIGAALAGAVAIALAVVPEPLPAPHVLAHDPVPAERIRWTVPSGCGISDATLDALIPHPAADTLGVGETCSWSAGDPRKAGIRRLDVSVTPHHAGPGVPGPTDQGNSSVAAAIAAFGGIRYQNATVRTVTGLGEEAMLVDVDSSTQRSVRAEFRTGNVVVSAGYSADTYPYADKPVPTAKLRAGALRAATDAARGLGAPAAPTVTAPPTARPAVRTPPSACAVVPSGLQERLLGDDPESSPDDQDVFGAGGVPTPGATQDSCDLSTDDRRLTVAITTGTAPTAARDIGREYLRRHLDARAEQPISRRDERYFHALSGLGDQAFAAYLEEGDGTSDVRSPARVVARVGTALISVTYGSADDPYADIEPLTREEAVDGAYAAAVRVVRAVRR